MSRLVIGVTGLPCTGKSAAARLLAQGTAGLPPAEFFEADDAGRRILASPAARSAVCRGLGLADAADDAAFRRAVADAVFADSAKLQWLESFVHPRVCRAAQDRCMARTDQPLVIEAALLFAGGLAGLCTHIMLLHSPLEVRLARAAARGWTPAELDRRSMRQQVQFADAALEPWKQKISLVNNPADDGLLAERIHTALEQMKVVADK